MNHVPDHELLSAYLDGELTAAEQAEVERLLAADPAVRQLLDEMRALGATLQACRRDVGEDLGPQVLRIAQRRMLTGEDERPTPAQPQRPFWREIGWRAWSAAGRWRGRAWP